MKKIYYGVRNVYNSYNYGDFEYKADADKTAEEFNKDSLKEENTEPFYVKEIEQVINEVEDVTLTKGSYGHDLLEWSYNGKDYSCEGEFYVDKWGNLRHTFIAPDGTEIEIITNYFPEADE